MNKKRACLLAGIVVGLLVGFALPVPAELATAAAATGTTGRLAMVFLGSVVWAVFCWIGQVASDWLIAMGMLVIWTVTGCCSLNVAFSQFAGSTVWLIFGAFGIAAAVMKTGVLKRLALMLMKLFPPTFSSQLLAMMTVGTIISPLLPSTTAKGVLGANMAVASSEAMQYKPYEKGPAGLFMASWVGFSLTAPAFLSASVVNYVLKAALPAAVQPSVTWGSWLVAMLPWLAIVFVGMFFILKRLYRPQSGGNLTKDALNAQLTALGPWRKQEIQSTVILFACLVLWILERPLGLSSAATALIGGGLCFGLGILEPKDLGTRINWSMVLFIGCVVQMGNMFTQMGVSAWLQVLLAPVFSSFTNVFALTVVLVLLVIASRFLIASQTACIMLFLAIVTPVTTALGMNPFVLGLIVYTAVQVWYVPYQNSVFAPALGAAEGWVRHKDTVKSCLCYCLLSLAACLASIPYWSLLGYL